MEKRILESNEGNEEERGKKREENEKRESKTLPASLRNILFLTSLNCRNTFCGLKTSEIEFSGHTFFL